MTGIGPMFLHTSPEYAMKRLLAAGIGDCYQVCRVFRDGERGSRHNPEFTMIEWYRLGLDASGLMDDVEALVAHVVGELRPLPRAGRITYREAVRDLCGIDPMTSPANTCTDASSPPKAKNGTKLYPCGVPFLPMKARPTTNPSPSTPLPSNR